MLTESPRQNDDDASQEKPPGDEHPVIERLAV